MEEENCSHLRSDTASQSKNFYIRNYLLLNHSKIQGVSLQIERGFLFINLVGKWRRYFGEIQQQTIILICMKCNDIMVGTLSFGQ